VLVVALFTVAIVWALAPDTGSGDIGGNGGNTISNNPPTSVAPTTTPADSTATPSTVAGG
jgi:hypothetical protein